MGVLEKIFHRDTSEKDLHKAFKAFTVAVEDRVKWLPNDHQKHRPNARLFLNNIQQCADQAVLHYNGGTSNASPDENLLRLVENAFLLMYAREMFKE